MSDDDTDQRRKHERDSRALGRGLVTPAEQPVDAKVVTVAALRDSWCVIAASTGSFLVVGGLAGATLSFGLFFGHWLATVLAALIVSSLFTVLCQMALRVLKGREGGIPAWEQVRSRLPATIGVVTVCGSALGVAGIVLGLLIRSSSAPNSGFFDGVGIMMGFLALVFALPYILAMLYGLILPSLFLAFPAVADGIGAMEAVRFSVGRGMKNLAALFGLEIAGTIGFAILLVMTLWIGSALAAMGDDPYHPPAWVRLCVAGLVALEGAIFLSWLAAVATSAYLQIGPGRKRRSAVPP